VSLFTAPPPNGGKNGGKMVEKRKNWLMTRAQFTLLLNLTPTKKAATLTKQQHSFSTGYIKGFKKYENIEGGAV